MSFGSFNPRPPRGGRLQVRKTKPRRTTFQSTPPARGATRISSNWRWLPSVSIHAPRAGGDRHDRGNHEQVHPCFNPRPPRGGRRRQAPKFRVAARQFQSTPPARGATSEEPYRRWFGVSIHAPRAGGDCASKNICQINGSYPFQRELADLLLYQVHAVFWGFDLFIYINILFKSRKFREKGVRFGFAYVQIR